MVTRENMEDQHLVLDKGFVRYISHMGDDLMVVNAARVSFNKRSALDEHGELSAKDRGLLSYLARHDHWTPFSHPQICLHFKAPIFIRAQFFKHKVGFTENEVSRRYVTTEPEFYWPEWRSAPTDGAKQGSADFMDTDRTIDLDLDMLGVATAASSAYRRLLEAGVAPEQARSILPQNVYTEWWWTGSLAAWSRFYNQRSDPHAQWEAQQYATIVDALMWRLFPASWSALVSKE